MEESEDIINGLLQGAAEFYGAARASVVEADWDLKIGLLTYEWCAEGVEHQKDMLQYLAVESFPRWCDFFSLNKRVVIPDMEAIKDTYPDEYQFFQRYGVQSVLAAPFSKRINQGYIAVDDPTRFQDDPTFLFIISYAVVVELSEIKLSQSIAAAQRASKYSDRDVYVNRLGDLEIRNAKGTLTEEDISCSDDNSNAVIEQFKSCAGITALTKEISAYLLQSVTIYPDGRMDIRLNLAEGMYYDGVNETSTILKIEFEGQSILFLADAIDTVGEIFRERFGGVGLECTYLQAAHHCINRVEDIYNSVKAKAILIPQCRYIAESRHYDNYRLICDCYGAENTFFAGDCTRICFTDGQTSRIEYYPTVGGKYDGSEY